MAFFGYVIGSKSRLLQTYSLRGKRQAYQSWGAAPSWVVEGFQPSFRYEYFN
jgi:hypothetical protein